MNRSHEEILRDRINGMWRLFRVMEGVESRGKSQVFVGFFFFLEWWEKWWHNSNTGKTRKSGSKFSLESGWKCLWDSWNAFLPHRYMLAYSLPSGFSANVPLVTKKKKQPFLKKCLLKVSLILPCLEFSL